MRVIAGEAKGRRLTGPRAGSRGGPAASALRPTTDRVREALFAALGPGIAGRAVLDLYAGTGALGIEALSRGARLAVFVDQSREAVATIARNLAATGLSDRARVEQATAERFAAGRGAGGPFDLVLMDPPYGAGFPTGVVEALAGSGQLGPEALVVVEVAAATAPSEPAGLQVVEQRRYGDSALVFLRPPEAVPA